MTYIVGFIITIFILFFLMAVIAIVKSQTISGLKKDQYDRNMRRWVNFGTHNISTYLADLDNKDKDNKDKIIRSLFKVFHMFMMDACGEVIIKKITKKPFKEEIIEHYKCLQLFKDKALRQEYDDYICPEENKWWEKD